MKKDLQQNLQTLTPPMDSQGEMGHGPKGSAQEAISYLLT